MKNQRGFTLIESIIVITIILALSVVALLSTHSQNTLRLHGAAHQLVTDIRYAQECAISQRVNYGVYFSPSEENYYVYRQNISSKAVHPVTGEEYTVDYDTDPTLGGVDIVSTSFGYQLEFDGIGEPYTSGGALSTQGNISLHSGEKSLSVMIEPETGKAFVQ